MSDSADPELERLRADYPSWSVWQSRADNGPGAWYATRPDILPEAAITAGCAQTVCGDTLPALREELDGQAAAAKGYAG